MNMFGDSLMKPAIKTLTFLLAAVASTAFAAAAVNLVVPAGDVTYSELAQLEKAGLLAQGTSEKSMTRMEVAQAVLKAQRKYREIVVAQADAGLPPPPTDDMSLLPPPSVEAPSVPAASVQEITVVPAAPAVPAVTTMPSSPAVSSVPASPAATKTDEQAELIQAAQNLHSLQEAYDYELKSIKGNEKSVGDRSAKVEEEQFVLMKRLNGIVEYPSVSWHGLGRAYGWSQQYYGDSPALSALRPSSRQFYGFIDFEPMGSVDKNVRWNALIRYSTLFQSNSSVGIDLLYARRATVEFNPPWFSSTIGDFEESYTPLTLWNRNSLDLKYSPEMIARQDDYQKYESLLNDEPKWPFRGLRVGTDVLFQDSPVIDRLKVSAMAHMIRSGFNETTSGGTYYGPTLFSDWVFGAKGSISTKRWYLGGASLQGTLEGYGVMLDEPLYSNQPYSPYAPLNPDTWAHQYQLASVKPTVDVGLGGDTGFGASWEGAFSIYVDDKRDSSKNVSDYAVMGGPYFRFGHSRVTANVLDVGPNYLSPLAQTRQDNITTANPAFNGLYGPGYIPTPLRSQFFLSDVPRAGNIFSFYDRTQDSTFPYGMASPNRTGFGVDVDVKTLEKDALKIPASAYFVKEISDNLVANVPATGNVAVDGVPGAPTHIRSFTYINVGPSFDLAPYIQREEPLEVGVNVRYEQTSSALDSLPGAMGPLTSTWILGGIKAGIFSWWEVSASFGTQQFSGTEVGYLGTTLARYAYQYDNSDLVAGGYQPFNVDGSRQTGGVSTTFKFNRNSSVYFDYNKSWGSTLNNQFMELTYEIEF